MQTKIMIDYVVCDADRNMMFVVERTMTIDGRVISYKLMDSFKRFYFKKEFDIESASPVNKYIIKELRGK